MFMKSFETVLIVYQYVFDVFKVISHTNNVFELVTIEPVRRSTTSPTPGGDTEKENCLFN